MSLKWHGMHLSGQRVEEDFGSIYLGFLEIVRLEYNYQYFWLFRYNQIFKRQSIDTTSTWNFKMNFIVCFSYGSFDDYNWRDVANKILLQTNRKKTTTTRQNKQQQNKTKQKTNMNVCHFTFKTSLFFQPRAMMMNSCVHWGLVRCVFMSIRCVMADPCAQGILMNSTVVCTFRQLYRPLH